MRARRSRFIVSIALLTIALSLLLTPIQRRLATGRAWARHGVLIAAAVSLWIAWVERSLWMTIVPFAAALIVCTAMRNVDHMYFSYVAGPFVAAVLYLMFRLRSRLAPAILAIVIAIGSPAATFDTIGILRRGHGPLEPRAEIADPPRARDALWLPYYAHLVGQSKHFIDRLPPGDTFFDFTNRGTLYFLFDRDCPVRQTEVAYYEPEARQREIIAAIERNPHVVAALVPPPRGDTTGVDKVPNPVRAPLVWKYLQTHFQPEFQEGEVVFWRRNGAVVASPR